MLYILRRLITSAFILLGVSVVTFGLTFMIPADPVSMIAGRNSTPKAVRSSAINSASTSQFQCNTANI